jgi:hypothetical protein
VPPARASAGASVIDPYETTGGILRAPLGFSNASEDTGACAQALHSSRTP